MSPSSTRTIRVVRRAGVGACLTWLTCLALGWLACAAVLASPQSRTQAVRYHGYTVHVPSSWPVYHLASDPHVCVRFDRNAVYLGQPGSQQNCPAHAVGRTEAILLEPASGGSAAAASARAVPPVADAGAPGTRPSSGELTIQAHGVTVTATWHAHPATLERALGTDRLPSSPAVPAPAHTSLTRAGARVSTASPRAAQFGDPIYTGRGFDTCATPSISQMSAWNASPYRAAGVYIGGTNMACAQPNLNATWVSSVVGAGWHVVPIYVGLQAPGNSCGCAAIAGGQAAAEGAAAANDAVAHAQANGVGSGNAIYYDMEAYNTGDSTTTAVMTFLSAWTARLHADGYQSGVYSSGGSGIRDLVARYGTGYQEPDDIWFADWNGAATTNTSYVPAGEWSNHQRLHQYAGGVNESYGGVKLNIDRDYLDGPTVGVTVGVETTSPPHATAAPSISGAATVGKTLSERHGAWIGAPTSYTYQWERCANSGGACSLIAGASARRYTLTRADLDHAIRVSETARNATGASAPAASAATRLIHDGSYWLYSVYGNVYGRGAAHWYGSPFGRAGGSAITGMARSPTGRGYWLVDAKGGVFAYRDATSLPAVAHAHPVRGIVGDPAGGYWLYTAYGNVYHLGGAGWYGSPVTSRVHTASIVGMASTSTGRGYWLVTSGGGVLAYGDATSLPAVAHAHPVRGIVGDPAGGYWLYTAYGNVYHLGGAGWYGSPVTSRVHTASIVGMASTLTGRGYWLVTSGGGVLAYGDAASLPAVAHPYPIVGMVR